MVWGNNIHFSDNYIPVKWTIFDFVQAEVAELWCTELWNYVKLVLGHTV